MSQTLEQFVSTWNGKAADFDGAYGNQCVDLVNYYERDVIGGGFVPAEGAKDWIENYPRDKYTYEANDMGNPNQLPARGDVVIWNGTLSGSHGYGHIGVVLAADKAGFTSFDQNFPSGSLPHQQYHKWDSTVAGWLHPKTAVDTGTPSTPAPAPAQAATKQYVAVFGDYRTLYRAPGSQPFQRIAPNSFPGGRLNYEVLDTSGAYVKIHTSYYGDGWIYAHGAAVDSITQFYNA